MVVNGGTGCTIDTNTLVIINKRLMVVEAQVQARKRMNRWNVEFFKISCSWWAIFGPLNDFNRIPVAKNRQVSLHVLYLLHLKNTRIVTLLKVSYGIMHGEEALKVSLGVFIEHAYLRSMRFSFILV